MHDQGRNNEERQNLRAFFNHLRRFGNSDDALARVVRNSAWLFSSKGLAAILSLFYLAIVTRTLGPEGFGEFILVVSAVQILFAILRFETWQSIVHFGAPYLLSGDKRRFSTLALATVLIELAGSLGSVLLLVATLPLLTGMFGWQEHIVQGALVYAIFIFFSMRSSSTGILRANDQFKDNALSDTMIPVARLFGCILVLNFGASLIGFLMVWGISEVVAAMFNWYFIVQRKAINIKMFKPTTMWTQLASEKDYFKFLLSTNFTYLLSALRERLVVVVIGMTVTSSAAGLFRLADQLANSINRITEIFARPLFAELSQLYAARDSLRLRSLFLRSLKISIFMGAAMFALLVLFGQPLIYAMSGAAYASAYPLLVLLGGATTFGLVGLGLEPLVQAAGKANLSLYVRLFGLVLLIALVGIAVVLFPGSGAMGASIAMVVSAGVMLGLMLWLSWREIQSLK